MRVHAFPGSSSDVSDERATALVILAPESEWSKDPKSPALLAALAPLADPRGLSYSPTPFGAMEARNAIVREYARRGHAVSPDRIALTASTSEAYALLFKLLADADGEVLVPRPGYPLFDHLTRLELVSPRSYDLEHHGAWSIDFASLERGWTSRTRAVVEAYRTDATAQDVWKRDGAPHEWSFEGIPVRVEMRDESAKIDINSASDALLRGLLVSVGLPDDEADSLLEGRAFAVRNQHGLHVERCCKIGGLRPESLIDVGILE